MYNRFKRIKGGPFSEDALSKVAGCISTCEGKVAGSMLSLEGRRGIIARLTDFGMTHLLAGERWRIRR